jgi:hypothetical protein
MFPRPFPSPNDHVISVIIYLIVGIALVITLAGARDARGRTLRLLIFYLGYILFELVLKRVTHFTFWIYPIRATLLCVVLVAWWSNRRYLRQKGTAIAPLGWVVGAYILLGAVQVFNPLLGDPLVGVMGFYSGVIFALFYFLAFDLFDAERITRQFFVVTAVFGALSAVGCFLEQAIGPEELLREYPVYVPLVSVGDSGRAIVRPWLLSIFAEVFAICATVGLLAARGRGPRLLLIVGLIMSAAANLLHGVRIAWLTLLLILGVFTLLNWRRSVQQGLMLGLCLSVSLWLALNLGDGFVPKLMTIASPLATYRADRLGGLLALPTVAVAYPFGFGIGANNPGLRFVEDAARYEVFGTHNYLTDLAGQMSLLGPIVLLGFAYGVVRRGVRAAQRPLEPARRAYLTAAVAMVGGMTVAFFGGFTLTSSPAIEYYWLAAGLAMRVAQHDWGAREALPPTKTEDRRPRRPWLERRLAASATRGNVSPAGR